MKEKLSQEDKPEKKVKRREFLKVAGLTVLGLAVEACAPRSVTKFFEKGTVESEESKQELIKDYYSQINEMRSDLEKVLSEKTLEGQEKARKFFQERYQSVMPAMLDVAFYLKKDDPQLEAVKDLYDILQKVSLHGLMYAHLQENGEYEKDKELFQLKRDHYFEENHFMVDSRDFVPHGNEIEDEEIDPRLYLAEGSNYIVQPEIRERLLAFLEDHPGFLKDSKTKEFKKLLDSPSIREKCQQRGLRLAEVYSIIKAIIKYQENDDNNQLSEDLVAEKLFEQRKEFGKYEFLSEKTKNVIVMSGFDYRTGYDFEDQVGITSLAKAANVPDENISVIDGKEGETAVENLHTQIANSSGQTVLWLEGHGSLDGKHMAVNKEVKLKVSQIAEALIARLLKTKDPETCKDLTIGFEACFSYDITNNIMTEMERVYRLKAQRELDVPFEEISLPKVITSSYEASWSTHSAAVIGQPIAKYAEYIHHTYK